jgi:signal transduction histidine kinase
MTSDTQPTVPAVSVVVRTGRLKGKRYRLFPGMIIGRGEQAHLYLPDFKVSRQHARIDLTTDGFGLEDRQSHNGTFVNGDAIDSRPLRDGDIIHIGGTRLEVIYNQPAPVRSMTPTNSEEGTPTIMSQLDMRTPPTLDTLLTDEYYEALGIPSPDAVKQTDPDLLKKALHKTRNFAIVYGIARTLRQAGGMDELLQQAMDHILKVIQADRAYILQVDPNTGDLLPVVSHHRNYDEGGGELEVSQSILEWVIREKQAVLCSDAASDQRFQDKGSIVLYNIRSVLSVPMIHGDQVIGVIQLDALGGGAGFTEDDLDLLGTIAPLLAIAVENARLFEAQAKTIAELRAAHAKIIKAQEQLVGKEKMAIVGQITAGLTHEIRNLMGPFMLADLLQAEYPDDERIQDYANLMLEAYSRIGSLVEEIGRLARGEQPNLEMAENDIEKTIQSVLRFARCDQQVQQHRLIPECQSVPPFVYDEGRIKQVLINLIRNATQAMEEPGDINIRSLVDPDNPQMACLVVADQGVGIPADIQDKIWEPFFSTKGEGGTGLGLDVCKGIIESHKGTIVCESQPGVGTTMTVRFPMKKK